MEYALIEYIFVFDPRDTWASLPEFEISMKRFLNEEGMDMQIVKNVEGGNSRRMILISKKPEEPIAPPKESPKQPKQQLKEMAKNIKVTNEKVKV